MGFRDSLDNASFQFDAAFEGGTRIQVRDRDLERGTDRHRSADGGPLSGLRGCYAAVPVRAEAVRPAGGRLPGHAAPGGSSVDRDRGCLVSTTVSCVSVFRVSRAIR